MKKIILLVVITMSLISCMKDNNSGLYPENKLVTQQPKLENTLKEGVIVGISKVVTTHDSSNDRAVNGALLGGAASYFLSRRPSITKTLIGASTGAVVGKTTGGDITQTTNYILTIKNLSDNSITQKATTSSGFMVKDTINYDEYSDVIFKKS